MKDDPQPHFVVTDHVPLPDVRKPRYHGTWSVFMAMRKGQSFTVPKAKYKHAWSAIKWWSHKYGIKLHMARKSLAPGRRTIAYGA